MVARLAKQFREQRIVAPLSLVAHRVEREQVLEHKTGQVPGRNHIAECRQFAPLGAPVLSGCGGLVIAIQTGVVAVEAFADNQHDVPAAVVATVHRDLVDVVHQFLHLFGCQGIGIHAEGEPVERLVEHGFVLAGHFMLHISNVVIGHQPCQCHFVAKGLGRADDKANARRKSHPGLCPAETLFQNQEPRPFRCHPLHSLLAAFPYCGPGYMQRKHQQHPAQSAENQVGSNV